MVARGPGDVGCAHCTKFGAAQACQVCTRLVCDGCANDWTTCAEPVGREIRLGMSARVRDVDAAGNFAFVTHAIKAPRLLHLRTLTWLAECPVSRTDLVMLRGTQPRLTSDGFVVRAVVTSAYDEITTWGVQWQHVANHTLAVTLDIEPPARHTQTSAHEELFAYVSGSERVVVMKHEHSGATLAVKHSAFSPLPHKVIHALHLDRDILATGTWRVLSLDRIVDDKLEHIVTLDTGYDANIRWIEIAGSHLAYEVHSRIEVRRLDANYQPGPVIHWRAGRADCAALSVDGRQLAVAYGKQLIVRDLEAIEEIEYSDHTDTISFLRFTHDHLLVSADDDNRLILRPRGARALIAANLGD